MNDFLVNEVLDSKTAKAVFRSLIDHGSDNDLYPEITPVGRLLGINKEESFDLWDKVHYHVLLHVSSDKKSSYCTFYFEPYVDYNDEDDVEEYLYTEPVDY